MELVEHKSCGGEGGQKVASEAGVRKGCPLPPERRGREWALRKRRNLQHDFVEAGRFLGGRRGAFVFVARLFGGEGLDACTQSKSAAAENLGYKMFGHGFARLTLLEAKG